MLQRIGQLLGALVGLRVGLPVNRTAFRQACHNLLVAMAFGRMDKNVRNHQRTVHHVCAQSHVLPLNINRCFVFVFCQSNGLSLDGAIPLLNRFELLMRFFKMRRRIVSRPVEE